MAEAIVNLYTCNQIADLWDQNSSDLFTENNFKLAEINALICCIKVNTLESTTRTFSEARLSCGGIGYSHYAGL